MGGDSRHAELKASLAVQAVLKKPSTKCDHLLQEYLQRSVNSQERHSLQTDALPTEMATVGSTTLPLKADRDQDHDLLLLRIIMKDGPQRAAFLQKQMEQAANAQAANAQAANATGVDLKDMFDSPRNRMEAVCSIGKFLMTCGDRMGEKAVIALFDGWRDLWLSLEVNADRRWLAVCILDHMLHGKLSNTTAALTPSFKCSAFFEKAKIVMRARLCLTGSRRFALRGLGQTYEVILDGFQEAVGPRGLEVSFDKPPGLPLEPEVRRWTSTLSAPSVLQYQGDRDQVIGEVVSLFQPVSEGHVGGGDLSNLVLREFWGRAKGLSSRDKNAAKELEEIGPLHKVFHASLCHRLRNGQTGLPLLAALVALRNLYGVQIPEEEQVNRFLNRNRGPRCAFPTGDILVGETCAELKLERASA